MENGLERYYGGDENWLRYVEAVSVNWSAYGQKTELLDALNGQEDIAKVCVEKFPYNIFKVITEQTNSLGGLCISQCCSDEKLIKRVRTMLMRMP
ncbi:hypothetical protein SAMN02745181_3591 [Rubritalea squalenifaciens DSM 18772]|uniref:Uncharacterized protein n=1 Tax=Rubritalea squalenifaciens DSM 18772 TaxID=1123071 RepID=A0A1M6RAX2_9BACT|nr:hypothetical protein [Rubritalea squalenifaciens]SHK29576.1 hypothetical protein SAMN02745181_3591 [Rubritalea squalenifaciens DSM 18772]